MLAYERQLRAALSQPCQLLFRNDALQQGVVLRSGHEQAYERGYPPIPKRRYVADDGIHARSLSPVKSARSRHVGGRGRFLSLAQFRVSCRSQLRNGDGSEK